MLDAQLSGLFQLKAKIFPLIVCKRPLNRVFYSSQLSLCKCLINLSCSIAKLSPWPQAQTIQHQLIRD